jgi:hypothetical protein
VATNPFFADATTNAGLNALAATANGGTLNVYNGSQPADANTAITSQTLLVTLTFSGTAFGNAAASGSAGSKVSTATANAITAGTATATGTATWFRILTSGSAVCIDGSVGASGCDLNLSSTAVSIGAVVSISGFTISQTE